MDFLNNPDASGGTTSGEMTTGEMGELQKALSAGYGSDASTLQGGSALRIQSLDNVLQATVQDNSHFSLFNMLAKPKATAVLDEWTEQSSIGGFLGDSYNDQDGAAEESNGDYQRMTGRVKYMTTYRKIPIVLQTQNNIVDATALETTTGAKQLLSSIEFGLYEGDDDVLPKSFPGIRKQIESLGSADHIIDNRGLALASIDKIALASEVVFGFGNFGKSTDIFLPPSVQTDLNMHLDPAFRVALDSSPNSVSLGTNVRAIQTSYGSIATRNDVFIRDQKLKVPFELRNATHLAQAVKNAAFKPASFTAVAAAGGATSQWTAPQAGTYVYWITGITHTGESQAIAATGGAVTVAAGDGVTLTIAPSASGTETGYVIYRGKQNDAGALTNVREMVRIAKTPTSTVFVDRNQEIPGSTSAFVMNLSEADHAIAWRQFMPMLKIPMAAVNSPIVPWLQMICGYLRISKRRQHVVIKNIVPNGSVWKPFV